MSYISRVGRPASGLLHRLAAWSLSKRRASFLSYLAIAIATAVSLPAGAAFGAPLASPAGEAATPVEIVIPSIGVDAVVEQVGLAPDGAMDVPRDPGEVAWYTLGPAPGGPGNAVIAGHVDWAGALRPFYGLRYLQPGDAITVVTSDSTQFDFTVTRTEVYEAAPESVSAVFQPDDDTALTLITCGGDFDRTTRQYLQRVVVRAVIN